MRFGFENATFVVVKIYRVHTERLHVHMNALYHFENAKMWSQIAHV